MACQRLDKSSCQDLIRNIDTCVFDCDGVLWNPNGNIEGSIEAVNQLRKMGKKVLYLTNNCNKSRAQYVQKLNQMGFQSGQTDVMCPAYMAALYLQNRKFKGKVYLIGNSNIASELDACNVQHFGEGPDPIEGDVKDWIQMEIDPDVRCVLVGTDNNFSFMKIIRASRYLERPDCIFLTTNLDRTHPPVQYNKCTVAIPGTGTLAVAIAYSTNRQPIILGKPRPFMFEELRKMHNLDPKRCLMIGDTVRSDIGLAKASGLKSLLVLSGITRKTQIPMLQRPCCDGFNPYGSSTDPPIVPDFYTQCIGDILTFLD